MFKAYTHKGIFEIPVNNIIDACITTTSSNYVKDGEKVLFQHDYDNRTYVCLVVDNTIRILRKVCL